MRELAAEGIPVAITCRVLKIARQHYYRWLAQPVTPAELEEAYRTNALHDAHREDPEFGYRYLHEEAAEAGEVMAERTAWRICADNGWWSAFAKRRCKNGKQPGPPVHDDLVQRKFTAEQPNELWLTDITEHRTGEGKLYLRAIKDAYSRRIVGYSIDSRWGCPLWGRSRAWRSPRCPTRSPAAAPRAWTWLVAWSTATAGRNSDHDDSSTPWPGTAWSVRWAASAPRATTPRWKASSAYCRTTSWTTSLGHSRGAADRDRHLDRADLPPASPPVRPGSTDPYRVRDHHDPTGQSSCVT
ncbi:hypothetical protein GCM10023225_10660 [Kineococcus glutinatus]|uniref:Integrase-like protein n=1 Tax=Kineococcus glutinatus TaxID=1070872 RepID=A0ABP9HHF8_9ACTN